MRSLCHIISHHLNSFIACLSKVIWCSMFFVLLDHEGLWVGFSCHFCVVEGLLLVNKNVLKARRHFQIKSHLEEVGTVGINLPWGLSILRSYVGSCSSSFAIWFLIIYVSLICFEIVFFLTHFLTYMIYVGSRRSICMLWQIPQQKLLTGEKNIVDRFHIEITDY